MFTNRQEAGQLIAEKIRQENINLKDALLVSLPKGGVIIGEKIAKNLKLPHKILISKKLVIPSAPELAMGALSLSNESLFLNNQLIKKLLITSQQVQEAIATAKEKIKNQEQAFGKAIAKDLAGKTVIITDDGAATGATLIAAIKHLIVQKPKKIIVALPVAPPEIVKTLKNLADQVIILSQPEMFFSVSQFYRSFPQVSLKEVKEILNKDL